MRSSLTYPSNCSSAVHLALIYYRRGDEPTTLDAEVNKAVIDGRSEHLPTPPYLPQQFAGRIDVAPLVQPPLHARNDRGVDIRNRPRQYSSVNGHVQCRRDQSESIDDAHDLRMSSTHCLRHLRERPPRFAEPFELGFDLLWSKRNKMAQPVVADAAVKFFCRRVELSAGGCDLILGDGLECAFRLNCGRDVDQTNQLTLPGRSEEIPPTMVRQSRELGC